MNRSEWAAEFFKVVDSQQPEDIVAYMTDDVRLQMANFEATVGIEHAKQAFAGAAEKFNSIQHLIDGVWKGVSGGLEVVSVESWVRYELADGREVEIPATSTMRIRDEKICDYRIYIDPTPAWS